MTQAVFPDFHKKMETIFMAECLFKQIRKEGKLQKIYCASLLLIRTDDLTLFTIDFFLCCESVYHCEC